MYFRKDDIYKLIQKQYEILYLILCAECVSIIFPKLFILTIKEDIINHNANDLLVKRILKFRITEEKRIFKCIDKSF